MKPKTPFLIDLVLAFVLALVTLSVPLALHLVFETEFEPSAGQVDHYIVMPEMQIP